MRSTLAILIVLAFAINACDESEDLFKRNYPRVVTGQVKDISVSGATFTASFFLRGDEPITNYGFVWSRDGSGKSIVGTAINFEGNVNVNFSAELKQTLEKDRFYSVRSFVKTQGHTVYGEERIFSLNK